MLQILPLNVNSTLEFSAIKENSSAALSDATCDDVMNVAIIIFSTLSVIAFVSCLTAAAVLSSVALGAAAGAVAVVALSLLVSMAFVREPIEDDFRYTTIYGVPSSPNSPYAESIVETAAFQNRTPPATPNTQNARLKSVSKRLDFDGIPLD